MNQTEQPRQLKKSDVRKKLPSRELLLSREPWLPTIYEIADASAIQALQRGDATPDQQKRALSFIIMTICCTYELPYRPGQEEGARNTDFAIGKMYVGQQIVKMLNTPTSQMKRDEPNADAHDPTGGV